MLHSTRVLASQRKSPRSVPLAEPVRPRTYLSIEQLCVNRGGRSVLRDLSLTWQAGTLTALVGASGVGKTSLLSALNGLLPTAAGQIWLQDVGRLDTRDAWRRARRQVANVFQEHALVERLSALDNVLLGLADRRHPLSLMPWPRHLRERAAQALADVGLLAHAHTRVRELSGGEQQRVSIARALVRRPRLLLGDEPFASVDVRTAAALAAELRRLVVRDGVTVMLALHQLQVARAFADRIVGLRAGGIVFDGPAAAFDTHAEACVFGPPAPSSQQGDDHVT